MILVTVADLKASVASRKTSAIEAQTPEEPRQHFRIGLMPESLQPLIQHAQGKGRPANLLRIGGLFPHEPEHIFFERVNLLQEFDETDLSPYGERRR